MHTYMHMHTCMHVCRSELDTEPADSDGEEDVMEDDVSGPKSRTLKPKSLVPLLRIPGCSTPQIAACCSPTSPTSPI